MNLNRKYGFWVTATLAAVAIIGVQAAGAQDTTTTKTPKAHVGVLTIDTADVVYVSGDDAVLKLPDGKLELFELRPGTSLTIDGKPSTAADLKPGMTVSHVQVKTHTAYDVTTVNQLNGTIVAKSGRILTLRLDDGTSKHYSVPYSATFSIEGKDTKYEDLRKGMKVSVTAVTTEGLHSKTHKAAMVAQTPPQSGTLVIVR